MTFGERAWNTIKGFFKSTWSVLSGLSFKTLGVLFLCVLIPVVILLTLLGVKGLRIGGLIGWLLGSKEDSGSSVIDQANTVDPDRKDASGKVIPIGQPDSKGITQVEVLPIKDPGVFSDPNQVVVQPPNSDKPVVIVLPDGITNSEVEQVVVATPKVDNTTVTDKSEITIDRIDDLLNRLKK